MRGIDGRNAIVAMAVRLSRIWQVLEAWATYRTQRHTSGTSKRSSEAGVSQARARVCARGPASTHLFGPWGYTAPRTGAFFVSGESVFVNPNVVAFAIADIAPADEEQRALSWREHSKPRPYCASHPDHRLKFAPSAPKVARK